MKKYKYKKIISFNTKYKRGDELVCIKDLISDNEILFNVGETYLVTGIKYSECGRDKTTEYELRLH